MRAIAPWWNSADLKAATSVGSAGFRPEFMPGTNPAPLLPASILRVWPGLVSLQGSAPGRGGCWRAGNMSKM